MLLALDAGNSNITIGAFEGKALIGRWRLRTIHEQTADEWGVRVGDVDFPIRSFPWDAVTRLCASVVPDGEEKVSGTLFR